MDRADRYIKNEKWKDTVRQNNLHISWIWDDIILVFATFKANVSGTFNITVQSTQVKKVYLKAIKITLGINQSQCSLWSLVIYVNDEQKQQFSTNKY